MDLTDERQNRMADVDYLVQTKPEGWLQRAETKARELGDQEIMQSIADWRLWHQMQGPLELGPVPLSSLFSPGVAD